MNNYNEQLENNTETVTISRAEYVHLKQAEQQNDWLMEQLKLSKKRLFGKSAEQAGEAVMEQLSFLFDEAEAMDANSAEEVLTESKVKSYSRKRRSGSIEDVIPENLPVERVEHRLSEEEPLCPVCGTQMVEIGSETRRTLKIEPPRYSVVEDVYYTYACKQCETETDEALVVKAPKEPTVLPGSFASPEAIARSLSCTARYIARNRK